MQIAGHNVSIRYKRVKNINMRLTPTPSCREGEVWISAPRHVSLARIVDFVREKSDWIHRQQAKMAARAAPVAPLYEAGARHSLWGQDYALHIEPVARGQGVRFDGTNWQMRVTPHASNEKKAALMEAAYRDLLLAHTAPLMAEWAARMNVQPQELKAQKMTSRWGSCHVSKGIIKLNSELARKPAPLLEYVLVHELVHLFERGHNARFYALMSKFLPDWQARKAQLHRGAGG